MTKRSQPPPMPYELQRRQGMIEKMNATQQNQLQQKQLSKSRNFRNMFQKR